MHFLMQFEIVDFARTTRQAPVTVNENQLQLFFCLTRFLHPHFRFQRKRRGYLCVETAQSDESKFFSLQNKKHCIVTAIFLY